MRISDWSSDVCSSDLVTDEVRYLSAMEEGRYTIAQANAELDKNGKFVADLISCRQGGEYIMAMQDSIDFIALSPQQLVPLAAALLTLLENDNATHARTTPPIPPTQSPPIPSRAPLHPTQQ